MNELYSIAPNACETGAEMGHVLQAFGPQAGRYVIGLPQRNSWCMHVLENHVGLRDIERQRLSRALDLARSRGAVIDSGPFTWRQERPWIENVERLWGSKNNHKKIYLSDQDFDAIEKATSEGNIYFARVADAGAAASNHLNATCDPENYWALMEILCSISSELHFMDPYFDPLRKDRQPIFEKILKELSVRSHVKRIVFWARHAEVAKGPNHSGNTVNKDALLSIIRSCFRGNSRHAKVSLNFVEDEASAEKMHARFLVTNRGGIMFEQGFQVLTSGKRAHVYAMGTSVKDEQFEKLSKGLIKVSIRDAVSFP